MNLNELQNRLQKRLGIVGHRLSMEEMNEIIKRIKMLPLDKRTEFYIEQIVTSVTGIDGFMKTEAVDMSDIGYIIQQIEAELKKKK